MQHFAAGQKKKNELLKHKEEVSRKRTEKMARLRALRLAKEASDQEAADKLAAEEAAEAAKAPPKRKKAAPKRKKPEPTAAEG